MIPTLGRYPLESIMLKPVSFTRPIS